LFCDKSGAARSFLRQYFIIYILGAHMSHLPRKKRPSEPETESSAKLNIWLEWPPGHRQAELADACSLSQQSISNYKTRSSRPDPGSLAAELIAIATGGYVSAAGWLTEAETRRRRQHRARAAQYANPKAKPTRTTRRKATAGPVASTPRTRSAPQGQR